MARGTWRVKRRESSALGPQVQNPGVLPPSEAEKPGEETERKPSREEGGELESGGRESTGVEDNWMNATERPKPGVVRP